MEISTQPADVVDQYLIARAARLKLQRQVDEMEEQEKILKDHLISLLREQRMTALGGKAGVVNLKSSTEPDTPDWPTLWKYIQETGAFELIQKRVSSEAVKERWANGEIVPGVTGKTVYKLSISGA